MAFTFRLYFYADNHVHFEVEQERALMAQNPEATVVFGVLNETSETESRVALTPDIVTRLKRSGVSSLIEAGAGIAADYTDEDYEKAGAKVTSRDEVLAEATRSVCGPTVRRDRGQAQGRPVVIGMLGSFTDADYVAALEKPVWWASPSKSCPVSFPAPSPWMR